MTTLTPPPPLSLFLKSILILEETQNQKTTLPFFADGYPGLIFQQTDNGLIIHPHNKKMPSLFLYGQTIKPIEMVLDGPYQLIICQLHPFVLKSFFDVPTHEIRDECYDLLQMQNGSEIVDALTQANDTEARIEIIINLLSDIFERKRQLLDLTIAKSIQTIISSKGQINIRELCGQLHLTERTFERRFLKEVGVSAKQFAQINQFQQSLQQLTLKEFTKLSDVVYANGFADQSHFIRVFKAFTGKTPKKFTPRLQ